jgi:hypothetical protein
MKVKNVSTTKTKRGDDSSGNFGAIMAMPSGPSSIKENIIPA